MGEFGMYPHSNTAVIRWMAERENAEARMELALTHECCRLLISQYDPVAKLGMHRGKLKILLDFVIHHDPERLRRECQSLMEQANEQQPKS